jgi:hypothetical protein
MDYVGNDSNLPVVMQCIFTYIYLYLFTEETGSSIRQKWET